ncbi:MAG: protein translocase subunit SecD [Candidatus Paceibacterota bacterium]
MENSNSINKYRFLAVFLVLVGLAVGYFNYISQIDDTSPLWRPWHLGLDLAGGSHLIYQADIKSLSAEDVSPREVMSSLREVIERRVNVFGVSEPTVLAEQSGFGDEAEHRLIVELPGITDIDEALALIDRTPELEFKLENPDGLSLTPTEIEDGEALLDLSEEDLFIPVGLTGRLVKRAQVDFNAGGLGGPGVLVEFNREGAELLSEITAANIGQPLAIILDGELKSAPIIRDRIDNGQALITGDFTIDEAKALVRDLNLGALPVPITLLSTQTIGAALGETVFNQGVIAGLVGLAIVSIFMLLWYRLPGLLAVLALSFYIALMLALFKLIPVTLTAAGIAGFILSIGIAVDANILIFERLKEELADGKKLREAINDGFARAWPSIRDSNLSSIISAIILFWFGTSLIKGFALTFGLGVIVSMFTAIIVTRTLLLAISVEHKKPGIMFLFGSGFNPDAK